MVNTPPEIVAFSAYFREDLIETPPPVARPRSIYPPFSDFRRE